MGNVVDDKVHELLDLKPKALVVKYDTSLDDTAVKDLFGRAFHNAIFGHVCVYVTDLGDISFETVLKEIASKSPDDATTIGQNMGNMLIIATTETETVIDLLSTEFNFRVYDPNQPE